MTRDEYLALKDELKERAVTLRSLKKTLRHDHMATALGLDKICTDPVWRQQQIVNARKREYRIKHIFMCLLRGKTREQIESNFGSQLPGNGLFSSREKELKDLCTLYGIEFDQDENYKVISVTRSWRSQGTAA
jgi:hypothetical protein